MAADRSTSPSWILFFHGSEISRAWLSEDQALHIALSAAAATQADRTGRMDRTNRTDGYLSGVTLVLSGAQSQVGPPDDQIGDSAPSRPQTNPALTTPSLSLIVGGIAEGHITAQGQLLRQLPAPGHQTGPLTLNLRLISGTSLSATGHSLRVALSESSLFRESWAC